MSEATVTLARSVGGAITSLRACASAAVAEAASSAAARRRGRAIMIGLRQRNRLAVDCIIWSAALTTFAFIS